MAGSRSFTNACNGNHGSHYTQTLTVSWGDYDITNNRTYVSISYQRTNSTGYNNYGYANPSQISIDGSQVASATPYSAHNQYATQTLCTWEGWIYHNNDGTKSINVSASFSSTSANLSGGSVSGTVQLPTIPRASSISATSVDIGSNTTISINRASTSFTHTITYSFGSLSGTIATKTSNASVSWTVPTTFYAQIPNAKSGTCTLTCKTFNGNTEIGSSTCTFTATANQSLCIPTLTGTIADTNSTTINLTGNSSKLIKYKSTAKITATATAKNSASISSVTIGGVSGSTRTISNVEQNSYTIIATDSRGYSKTITVTATMVNYIPLTASSTFKRKSQTGNVVILNYSGNYFNGSFGSQSNSLDVTMGYRVKGATSWNYYDLSPTIQSNKFSQSLELPFEFDYQTNYEFTIWCLDKLTDISTGINNVTKGIGALEIYSSAVKVNGDFLVSGTILKNGVNLFSLIYPIGSIYISVNNTNPSTLFGGTWQAFGTGRTLVGVDTNQTEFNSVQKTGGAKTHTLLVSEMPSHNHTQNSHNHEVYTNFVQGSDESYASTPNNGNGSNNFWHSGYTSSLAPTINNTGGSQAHNNLQPYITVYMWKRVS